MQGDDPQKSNWPLPKFFFSVDIEGLGSVSFQEVAGLETEIAPIEYRAGQNQPQSVIKMPGIVKSQNVTLKRGVFVNDNHFWDWYQQIKMNTIKRRPVTISLLDESATPTMVWKLSNAWPTKITGTDLKAEGNEIAIDVLELVHEGLTIENA